MISNRQPLRFSDRSFSFCIDWNFIQIMNRGVNEESRGEGSKKIGFTHKNARVHFSKPFSVEQLRSSLKQISKTK